MEGSKTQNIKKVDSVDGKNKYIDWRSCDNVPQRYRSDDEVDGRKPMLVLLRLM